jgi:hypothetical protein
MFKVKSCMSELRALQDAEERLADESKHAELREHMLARLRGDVEDSDREEW